MEIDATRCQDCGACLLICPLGAIHAGPQGTWIDPEACVDCHACDRPGAFQCPHGALLREGPETPESLQLRARFSDPSLVHPSTGIPGRGTDESKTNDVTGRIGGGYVGLLVELGRPCQGATFREAGIVIRALVQAGATLVQENPLVGLLENPAEGRFPEALEPERYLSAIVECRLPLPELPRVLAVLRQVTDRLDTVCSIGVMGCFEPDGRLPLTEVLAAAGEEWLPNAKVNLGMGRTGGRP